ncbi:hypothetical protein [Williamwhitmania taraxaci]|uniref:hypothetical protein n=1 Tax=Williamwhitmania taraxaci TaxID=1640674 RepID=UPI001481B481|nr:hypothetical protein [Williamwhitmania taraxaci]
MTKVIQKGLASLEKRFLNIYFRQQSGGLLAGVRGEKLKVKGGFGSKIECGAGGGK